MMSTRRRKRRRVLMHSKTELRRGTPLKGPPKRSSRRKASIYEIYPAIPDGLDEILFDVSNESLFSDRKKPS